MITSSLLGALHKALSLWDTKEGRKYLDDFLENKKDYDEELDKRSSGKRYSQRRLDTSLRNLGNIADAYNKYGPSPAKK
jgi:hypothetical protein